MCNACSLAFLLPFSLIYYFVRSPVFAIYTMANVCSVSSASICDDITCLLFCWKYCNEKQRIDSHPYCGRHCAGKAEKEADRQQKDLCKVSIPYPCQCMIAYMYIKMCQTRRRFPGHEFCSKSCASMACVPVALFLPARVQGVFSRSVLSCKC